MEDKKLKITLVKSTIGAVPKNRAIVESMGLRKLGRSVILPDNDAGTVPGTRSYFSAPGFLHLRSFGSLPAFLPWKESLLVYGQDLHNNAYIVPTQYTAFCEAR